MPTRSMFPNLIQTSNIGQNWQLGQNLSPENALKLQDIERRQQIANLFTQQAMTPKGAVKAGNRFMVAPSGWEHAATLMNAAAGAGGMYMAGQERQDMMADIIANRAKGMEDLQRELGRQPDTETVDLGLEAGFTRDPSLEKALGTPTPTVQAPPQPTVTNSMEPYQPIDGIGDPDLPTPGARDPNAVSFKPAGQSQARDPEVARLNTAMAKAGFRGIKDDALIQAPGQTGAISPTTTTPSAAPLDAGAGERLAVAKAMSNAGYPNKAQLDDMFISGRGAVPTTDTPPPSMSPTIVPTAAIPVDQAPSYLKLASDNLSKPTHEGFSLKAYEDGGGWSIGYGHHGPDVTEGMTITKEQAANYRDDDLAKINKGLVDRYPWFQGLDDTRKAFMVELAYNTGLGGIDKFKYTLSLIKAGDYAEAAANLRQKPWAQRNKGRVNDMLAQLESAPDVSAAPVVGSPQAMKDVTTALIQRPTKGMDSGQEMSLQDELNAVDPKELSDMLQRAFPSNKPAFDAAVERIRIQREQSIPSDTTVPSPVSLVASSLMDAQGPPPPSALSVKGAFASGPPQQPTPFSYSYKEHNTRDATPEERRNAYLKAEANPDPLVQRAAYRAMEMDDRDEQKQAERDLKLEIARGNNATTVQNALLRAGGRQKLSEQDKKVVDAEDAEFIAMKGLRNTLATSGAPGATGLLQGMVPDSILAVFDPEGIPTRSAVSNLSSMVLKARSGLAVTTPEYERLTPMLPTGRNTNAALKEKLDKFFAYKKDQHTAILARLANDGYDIRRLSAQWGIGEGPSSPPPADQSQVPTPSGGKRTITSFAPVQ